MRTGPSAPVDSAWWRLTPWPLARASAYWLLPFRSPCVATAYKLAYISISARTPAHDPRLTLVHHQTS